MKELRQASVMLVSCIVTGYLAQKAGYSNLAIFQWESVAALLSVGAHS